SRRRHTRLVSDWSSDVCSSDLAHADVHDPGRHLAAVITGHGHVQLRQRLPGHDGHAAPSSLGRRAETMRRNLAWRPAWQAAIAGSGSATRLAAGASGPWMSSKLSRPAATAPRRAAPRPDAAGTSTAYSGNPSTSASIWRQPAARVPPPASRRYRGPRSLDRGWPRSASSASRIANAAPSSAARNSDARSSASDNPVQEPRSAGSQYGVRSPDRCGTKIGPWAGRLALAYSSAQLAFMTSR